MKKIRWVISLIAVFLAFSPASGKTSEYSINPQPPEAQTSLKILTLNVMQRDSVNVPPVSRDSRFQGIADFLKNKNIHALTLQELSGGFLDVPNTTVDSGIDLAHKLAQQGQQYGYYTRDSYGYPDYLTFKVGVMPKYTMLFTDATRLDPSGENWSGGPVEFDGRSNAVVCGLNIPGIGRVNLYSVHVYTPTTVDQKETQIQNLIDFIHQVDLINPARLTIVGGDMNFAVSSGTQNIYQTFLGDGFVDSYMAVNSDSGDTFSLPDNPLKIPVLLLLHGSTIFLSKVIIFR
jgi:hypothetical protein